MYLDKDGFINGGQSGMLMLDEGEMLDLLYKRFKTEKWWMFFFPLSGLNSIYSKIENEYYTPGSERNKGFECPMLFDRNTVVVMCYKEWMSPAQLKHTMEEFGGNSPFPVDGQRDIGFIELEGENPAARGMRMQLYFDLHDYCVKQETGT